MDKSKGQTKFYSTSKENVEVHEIRRIVGDVRGSNYLTASDATFDSSSPSKLALEPPNEIRDSTMISQRSSAKISLNKSSVNQRTADSGQITREGSVTNAPNPHNKPDSSNPFAKTSLASTLTSNAANLLRLELSPDTPISKIEKSLEYRMSQKQE